MVLAYLMAIYVFASLYYVAMTRRIGTPFADSLTDEQKALQKASSKQRMNVFLQGTAVAVVLCVVFRPFQKC